MILQNSYYYWSSELPKDTCEKIINLGLGLKPEEGLIHRKEKEDHIKGLENVKELRKSLVTWLDDPWIYELLQPYIHTANREAGWNFQWDHTEMLQFTMYNEGHFYDWHPDQKARPYDDTHDENHAGKIRKISATISLNDSSEYEGGNLEFDLGKTDGEQVFETCNQIKPQGSIVVFPSFLYHRVTPITKGTRYSLVMWNIGYPFK